MATHTTCDACGSVIRQNGQPIHTFGYDLHIEHILEGRDKIYVDEDGTPTGGRRIALDLCTSCYNAILVESVKKLKEIRESLGITVELHESRIFRGVPSVKKIISATDVEVPSDHQG